MVWRVRIWVALADNTLRNPDLHLNCWSDVSAASLPSVTNMIHLIVWAGDFSPSHLSELWAPVYQGNCDQCMSALCGRDRGLNYNRWDAAPELGPQGYLGVWLFTIYTGLRLQSSKFLCRVTNELDKSDGSGGWKWPSLPWLFRK